MKSLEKIKSHYLLISFFVTLIFSAFMSFHTILNKIDGLVTTTKTTQQMALKSVIWNEDIPLTERSTACDVYLNAGYNSMTKKECEIIIEKASKQGVFNNLGEDVK